MKPVEEVPVEGKGNAPDREAKVPQAAAASRPTVESPAAKRAASPVREDRSAKNPVDTQEKDEKPSTRTMLGICGIPRRPRREHQLRSLEGACTIMRTRPTRSTQKRRRS